jgi:medium-chain acyl-[acyl-carrier-protein] hydrolase
VSTSHQLTDWVRCLRPSDRARARLFCLPYGGGGAAIFREWPRDLWPEIEVWHVQLPGREARHREPLVTRMDSLVTPLVEALVPHLDRPYAVFGHSMGALIGFELVRFLRRQGVPDPVHLLASARRAPHVPDVRPPLHTLPDPDLVEQLCRRYNGMPRAVLESPDLMRLFVPVIRADLTLTETYVYEPEEPLACPISAFGGLEDGAVTRDDLAAWGDQTRGSFTLRMLPGSHFFLQALRPRLVSAIAADLTQTLAETG